MPNLTSVTITAGVPTSGTGTVSTIDNIPALWDKGSGTGGSATQRVIVDSSQFSALGQTTKSASQPVVPASDWVYNTGKYVALPVSTTTTIQASAGAIGDYLDHIIVFPNTTAAGSIVIKDGATTIATYAGGGTTALLTLTPFTLYVGAISSVGAWSAVVGANVHAVAVGRFS